MSCTLIVNRGDSPLGVKLNGFDHQALGARSVWSTGWSNDAAGTNIRQVEVWWNDTLMDKNFINVDAPALVVVEVWMDTSTGRVEMRWWRCEAWAPALGDDVCAA